MEKMKQNETELYEYEFLFDSETVRGWAPVATARLKFPPDELIAQGVLRRIERLPAEGIADRAKVFIESHVKKLPLPVQLNGITEMEKAEAASICVEFATQEITALTKERDELKAERQEFIEVWKDGDDTLDESLCDPAKAYKAIQADNASLIEQRDVLRELWHKANV